MSCRVVGGDTCKIVTNIATDSETMVAAPVTVGVQVTSSLLLMCSRPPFEAFAQSCYARYHDGHCAGPRGVTVF